MSAELPRRDKCYIVGRRASNLTIKEAAEAWYLLATGLINLGESDMPKFKALLQLIRAATITVKNREKGQ